MRWNGGCVHEVIQKKTKKKNLTILVTIFITFLWNMCATFYIVCQLARTNVAILAQLLLVPRRRASSFCLSVNCSIFSLAPKLFSSPQPLLPPSKLGHVVAGRVIDSSLESSSLFSILVREREDSSLSSKARAYLGLVFTLIGISP
jgi:hypothetical protein